MSEECYPVVYGRTLRADVWWRALPPGTSREGWLTGVVNAAVAGGRRLDKGPRFVLSRSGDRLLVGVACQARELDEERNAHERRPLYTFVGWQLRGGSRALPDLAALAAHYAEWASPAYQDWVGRDWNEHPSRVREPHDSESVARPWGAGGWQPALADNGGPVTLGRNPGQTLLVPHQDRYLVWAIGLQSTRDFTLVNGWDTASDAPLAGVTHLCAADVTEKRWVRTPVPQARPVPPPPVTQEKHDPKPLEYEEEGGSLREDVGRLFKTVQRTVDAVLGRGDEPADNRPATDPWATAKQQNYPPVAQPLRADEPAAPPRARRPSGPVEGRTEEIDPAKADLSDFFDED